MIGALVAPCPKRVMVVTRRATGREQRPSRARGSPELLLFAGKPIPGTEIRIIDPDGRDLPPGEVGEICMRGSQIMAGRRKGPISL